MVPGKKKVDVEKRTKLAFEEEEEEDSRDG